jgi:hypothetical protein
MPKLTNIAMRRKPRPEEVDKFRDAFRVSGRIHEIATDKETAALLERFSGDPNRNTRRRAKLQWSTRSAAGRPRNVRRRISVRDFQASWAQSRARSLLGADRRFYAARADK